MPCVHDSNTIAIVTMSMLDVLTSVNDATMYDYVGVSPLLRCTCACDHDVTM